MINTTNIYVVEDEFIVAENIILDLKGFGYTVVGRASTGEQAIEEILELRPDLILMDINLKGSLTGIDVAHEIRTVVKAPIIFLTAYADERTLSLAKKAGAYGFLVKPFQSIDLKSAIEVAFTNYADIDQAKQQREKSALALKETEERYKQIVDNVSDLIYTTNHRGEFTFVNPAVSRLTGYAIDKIVGMHYSDLVRLDYQESTVAFYKKIFKDKEMDSYCEFPILTKDGEEIWIGQRVQLLKKGRYVVGFQATSRNITERVKFEKELIKAKEEAESMAQIKSQFLANMSHEIRTPLNGIVGIVRLLASTDLDEKQQKYLKAIVTSSNQLMGIINNVLDLSKIEAGKMILDETEFDFIELIESVDSLFETTASQKKIEFKSNIDQNIPRLLLGDTIKLNQILYNLIGNSIKFTEEGGVYVDAKLISESDKDVCIIIRIRDTGIGIEQDKIEQIFSAFAQAESNTTRRFGGSGLGLTIVQRLVELHNGVIYVKSELGSGAEFNVQISLNKVCDKSDCNEVIQDDCFTDVRIEGMHVLLVEDNKINQLVTSDLLRAQGVQVDIVSNGKEALEILLNADYDLVLMDMQMPIMDGYEAMRIIREEFDTPLSTIPIIALTAHAFEGELKHCMDEGADAYLSKPFEPKELFLKMEGLISILKKKEAQPAKKINDEISMTELLSFVNGDEQLLNSTLDLIQSTLIEDMKTIKSQVDIGDYDGVRRIAHRIKPNYALLGLSSLKALCQEIEQKHNNSELEHPVYELIKRTEIVFIAIEKELKNQLYTKEI